MIKQIVTLISVLILSSNASASDFINLRDVAMEEINLTKQAMEECGIRTVDVRGQYPRPYPIDADYGHYARNGRLIAVSSERIGNGVLYWNISNINGSNRYDVIFNRDYVDFDAPYSRSWPNYPQNAANANRVNYGGRYIVQGFCGGYRVNTFDQFKSCIKRNFTERLKADICNAAK